MKKLIVCVFACLMTVLFVRPSMAIESLPVSTEVQVMRYINSIYVRLDLCNNNYLPYDAFVKGVKGYINLRNAGRLADDNNILTICDMSKSSNENRMWVIDLAQKKILFNTYVAHGQGSGEEFATSFSNTNNSHKSSLGFYVTGGTYNGEHGNSLHLHGMDNGFNDAAFDRAIVVHGADYVCNSFIKGNERLGRSWGCPAVSPKLAQPIINTIKDGSCLFMYYPDKKYMKTAYWVNKKIDYMPGNNLASDIKNQFTTADPNKKREVIIVYENGHPPVTYQQIKEKEMLAQMPRIKLPLF